LRSNTISEIANALRKGDDFLLATHVHPDGDGIGAEIALALGLKQLKKKVTIINSDPIPSNYCFLPLEGLFKDRVPRHAFFSCAVALECSEPERLGKMKDAFSGIETIINIDHHPGNSWFGDYNYVRTEACAVGEQIYDILNALKVRIDPGMAACIYTSILTDTGSFSYSNTTWRTHEIVEELIKLGVSPTDIYQEVYESNSPGKIQLLGQILSTLAFSTDKRVAWVTLTRKMFKDTHTSYEDAEGMINYARSIKTVDIAISFTELTSGKVKVSFRSKSQEQDVNKIAGMFNGGGHTRASGCVVDDTLENTRKKVLEKVLQYMKKTDK